MNFASRLLRALDRVSPPETVSAHCDIPCGIYDPHAAQVAALTVLRMDQLIKALDRSNADQAAMQIARYTATKEAHAEL
jgi:nickel superoxide dismutase